jgi:hypothetical protein
MVSQLSFMKESRFRVEVSGVLELVKNMQIFCIE